MKPTNDRNHVVATGCHHPFNRRGFSLVELVIVILIIGVIAAIAVPRIASGGRGATEAALVADLKVLRHAIEIYAAEHDGQFPGAAADGGGNGPGTAGAFASQLTKYSSDSGLVSDTFDTTFRFGPYLVKIPPISVGPNKGDYTVAIDQVNSPPLVTGGTEAWAYNPDIGQIIANTDDADMAGLRAYDEY